MALGLTVVGGWGLAAAQEEKAATQDADTVTTLAPVVVTATRLGESNFDLPVAIDAVQQPVIQDQTRRVLVSEVLPRVPGTAVSNRGTFAQEEQIQIRGFGGQSQFGTRGVKLVMDGIPAGTPDGQGGPGIFDLGSTQRIEVMRGAFSALYGNHAGGVIQAFTEDGPQDPTATVRLMAGSYGAWVAGLKFGGATGPLNYLIDGYRAETDGYRDWSAASKDQVNAKVRYDLPNGGQLSVLVNSMTVPDSQDPLGLTAAEVKANRRQASPAALQYQTRRTLDNLQGGLVYEQPLSASDRLHATVYLGTRSNEQFLAVPLTNQNAITASGGVSTFDRDFSGGSLWLSHDTTLVGGPVSLTLGGEYEGSSDARKGYLNQLGEQGALKRDEDDSVGSWGGFIQAQWKPTPRWAMDLGLRFTEVHFNSDDHFICTTALVTAPGTRPGTCSGSTTRITRTSFNPDDSGSQTYSAWTPALGLVFSVTPDANLYANVGRTFETPTFPDLAYRPDGGSGLNFALEAATSWHYEIGAKFQLPAQTRLNLALFQIDTENELTVATNQGGRTTYQNTPASQRRGAELLLETTLGHGFGASLAATYLDAQIAKGYLGCTGVPCRTLAPLQNVAFVPAGNQLPGVAPFNLFGELTYAYAPWGFTTALDVYGQGRVEVNDANTDASPSYWTFGLRGGFQQTLNRLVLTEFARFNNVFNEDYNGAVNVNDSNGRYYAPAPGSNYLVGITASLRF
ncbi:MAG TPA: TonB-dependent receptor [Lamprocystis sp. (in: g-proteobacteria)]|nr:TonB-dependent receptor [Lamprocystis sp. (in: g-proteobacteria)]